MKIFRKLVSVAIVLLIVTASSLSAFAETYYVVGDYKLVRTESGDWAICEYNGNDTKLILPSQLIDTDVTDIYPTAFMDNNTLKSIDFSENIVSVGAMSFYSCSALETVNFNSALEKIVMGAFENCSALKKVDLSCTALEIVDTQVFMDCTSLTTVKLPRTCTEISSFAFYGDTALDSIFIPDSVNSIAKSAFTGCENLTIYCESGSYAHSFAETNNISYCLVDKYDKGDVDLDGNVGITDVTYIQKYIAEIVGFNELNCYMADIDSDGIVTISDATYIQKYIAEIIEQL